METALAWWRERTSREQLLLRIAAVLIFAIVLPLLAYQAAAQYRSDAADNLAAAQRIERDVARLAAAGPPPAPIPGGEGGVRALAMAHAQAEGLTIARIEPRSAGRFLFVFEPAHSRRAYRWIDAMARAGAAVRRTSLVRTGEDGSVAAEFEVEAGP
jgi:type II secretory pathway component PulM